MTWLCIREKCSGDIGRRVEVSADEKATTREYLADGIAPWFEVIELDAGEVRQLLYDGHELQPSCEDGHETEDERDRRKMVDERAQEVYRWKRHGIQKTTTEATAKRIGEMAIEADLYPRPTRPSLRARARGH